MQLICINELNVIVFDTIVSIDTINCIRDTIIINRIYKSIIVSLSQISFVSLRPLSISLDSLLLIIVGFDTNQLNKL